jgi:hypothetical protein
MAEFSDIPAVARLREKPSGAARGRVALRRLLHLVLQCAQRFTRHERDPLAQLDDEQARDLSELGRARRIAARFGADDESR